MDSGVAGSGGVVDDNSHGMRHGNSCAQQRHAHPAQVSEDGLPPTGLRYSINAISLIFKYTYSPSPCRANATVNPKTGTSD
jgi:peptide methionine sulfoxide reductase MsrB